MYIEVAYFVELSEFNYCIYGIIPEYASSKLYLSAEAQLEIDAVQDYVAALAEYDLHHPGGVALAAALDLTFTGPALNVTTGLAVNVLASACQDLTSFFSPAQAHIHRLVTQMPICWGDFCPLGACHLSLEHDWVTGAAPPTLWLSTPLLGGGRLRRMLASGSPGDGNGTDPSTVVTDSPSALPRPAPTVVVAKEASSDDDHVQPSKRSKRIFKEEDSDNASCAPQEVAGEYAEIDEDPSALPHSVTTLVAASSTSVADGSNAFDDASGTPSIQEVAFQHQFNNLQAWLRANPDKWPKRHSISMDEKRLARWLETQRCNIVANRVPPAFVQRLASLPGWRPVESLPAQWHSSVICGSG